MIVFEELNPVKVAVAGDWHANAHYARKAVRHAAGQGAEAILHVGDFAYDMRENFDGSPDFLDHVQDALEETGLVLGWVDGNHDNHTLLAELVRDHGHTAIPIRPNIYYLPRGYRWIWNGVRFLAMGGAHSVDRPWRRPHIEWWPGETITTADALRACEGGPADIMICHDVPAGVRIPCIEGNPYGFPHAQISAAELNRRVLRGVVDVVQPKRLFAGHYHCRLTAELVAGNYRTRVDILDADHAPVDANTTLLDLGGYSRL
ncbi:metallophosphoesterase family protein [Nocardia farcinica]|uniref:metallophosphoesterase family protein n=1 Tax=Nocardia farcinica TaxID=37329 RepID=UPI002458DB5E|nr:metallophosphoesterase [Nocardia farcinica]